MFVRGSRTKGPAPSGGLATGFRSPYLITVVAYGEIIGRAALWLRRTLLLCPIVVAAQGAPQAPSAATAWRVASPDAAVAWFDLLATLRLPGVGAFSLTAATRPGTGADAALARRLAGTRESEVLHFVPLYFPSGDRAALAAALRAAASDSAVAAPRATLVVGALRGAMSASLRQRTLPDLARALERFEADAAAAGRLAQLQARLSTDYLAALAPWLALERLDEGRLLVAPGIGPEGRLFAATPDRQDNLVAVGLFAADPDPEAPLLAFVRELCYPAVTRAVSAARLDGPTAEVARRSGTAAVRCGAALLDARLPDRSARYRAFWLRQSGLQSAGADTLGAFSHAFPEDAALAPHLARAIRRVGQRP